MFELPDLDQRNRQIAIDEIQADMAAGLVYASPRLNARGRSTFDSDLRMALRSGTPETLENTLNAGGKFSATEMSQRNGIPYQKRVPSNAASLLAGGAYVHYYIRAVCIRAIEAGEKHVVVYRARESRSHRAESDQQIGQVLDADELLRSLRRNAADPACISLPDVGSGLAVRRIPAS